MLAPPEVLSLRVWARSREPVSKLPAPSRTQPSVTLVKCCRGPVPAPDSQGASEGSGGWGVQLVPWHPGEMRQKAR